MEHRNQEDLKGKKVQYIKTEFFIRDDSTSIKFPGVWWGHYKDELPPGRCDCIVELDYNTYKKRYEIRIIAVRESENTSLTPPALEIIDWRNLPIPNYSELTPTPLLLENCPSSWDDLRAWVRRTLHNHQPLAIAWNQPQLPAPATAGRRARHL